MEFILGGKLARFALIRLTFPAVPLHTFFRTPSPDNRKLH
jgi:hypothetical protein